MATMLTAIGTLHIAQEGQKEFPPNAKAANINPKSSIMVKLNRMYGKNTCFQKECFIRIVLVYEI